jgi:hypothetical protein
MVAAVTMFFAVRSALRAEPPTIDLKVHISSCNIDGSGCQDQIPNPLIMVKAPCG